jgi:hypothetical protein
MLPALLLPALANSLPGLIQHFFGGPSPEEKLRAQIMQLLNPQNQAKMASNFYQQNIGSPAYSQAQGTIAAGANQTGANLARLAGGVGPGGTSALLSSILPSIVGSQQAGLRTSAYQSAQQQAHDTLKAQIDALTGTAQKGPGRTSQLFGAGLEGFQPFLAAWLKNKYPDAFGAISNDLPLNALQTAAGGNGGYQMPQRRG